MDGGPVTTQPGKDSRVHRASAALMHAALVGAGVVGISSLNYVTKSLATHPTTVHCTWQVR